MKDMLVLKNIEKKYELKFQKIDYNDYLKNHLKGDLVHYLPGSDTWENITFNPSNENFTDEFFKIENGYALDENENIVYLKLTNYENTILEEVLKFKSLKMLTCDHYYRGSDKFPPEPQYFPHPENILDARDGFEALKELKILKMIYYWDIPKLDSLTHLTLNLDGHWENHGERGLNKLENLTHLTICNGYVTYDLLKEICQLKNLEYLCFDNAEFADGCDEFYGLAKGLIKEIGNLKSLKGLYLCDTFVEFMDKEIKNLESLEYFIVDYNDRRPISFEFPKEFFDLPSLKLLYLDSDEIVSLPKEIANLQSLEELYFPGENTPKEIGELKSLKCLEISSYEHSSTIPPEIYELSSLEELALNVPFERIPKGIEKLENLNELSLYAYKSPFCGYDSLSEEEINNLSSFPEGVEKLKNLKTLTLGGYNYDYFPKEIEEKLKSKGVKIISEHEYKAFGSYMNKLRHW